MYKLKTIAKTFPEFEKDIKSKLQIDGKLLLQYNEDGQLIILDDIEDLEEGMTIKVSCQSIPSSSTFILFYFILFYYFI